MLLRTVALLLCVSLGMCATIGHFQKDSVENPALTEGALTDAPPAPKEPADNSFFGDNLLGNLLSGDPPAAKEPEADVPAVDGAGTENTRKDSEGTDGDTVDGAETVVVEAVTKEQTSTEEEGNDIKPIQSNQSQNKTVALGEESRWSINSIRNSFQTVHGYFDSLVELVGGRDGVCQYRCRYGQMPQPRPNYQHPAPDGCRSSLVGYQLDMGIPAMTNCCNQLDVCYDICGMSKYDCDAKFRTCLHDICSDVKKSLGFVAKVEACETMADTLYNTVWTLGCRPYMNSQRAACICEGEERDEL